jgi:hypothetical protein
MSRACRLALATASAFCALARPVPAHAISVPHILKGPYLTGLTEERVDIRFELDAAAPASLVVTEETTHAARPALNDDAGSMHVVHVVGLQPATGYTYEVRVAGAPAAKGRFSTAPRGASDAPARFLVYGDDRSDEEAHAALVRVLRATPSDFLVNTGDIVADGGNAADWQSFFEVEAPLLRERPLFLAIGNHELYNDEAGATFARYFGSSTTTGANGASGPAAPYGTMRWGPARFFFLNGMHDWKGGDERQWLERELARSDDEADVVWRVVVVHHGPWSSGPHGGNDKLLEARVPQLLASHKVDLLLAGHDHIYERGDSGLLKYVISGGGGAPLYPIAHRAPSARKLEPAYHFLEVSAQSDAMKVVAHRVDGTILEECGFRKGTAWDCDAVEASRPSAGGPTGAGAAGATGPVEASSRCGCKVPGWRGSSEGALAVVALGALATIAVRRRGSRGAERKRPSGRR